MIEELNLSRKNEIKKRDGFKCVECDSTQDLTVDHIIPVSKGGTNMSVNLRTLCGTCNKRKGNQIQWSLWKKITYALHVENLITRLNNELRGIIFGNLSILRNEITTAKQSVRDELLVKINKQEQAIAFLSKKITAMEVRSKIKWVEETTMFEGYKKLP